MATKVGNGYSAAPDGRQAGREAARAAKTRMGDAEPHLVLTFASTNYDYDDLLEGIREITGSAPLVGCSTAGQFTQEQVGRESVVVMTIHSDSIRFETALGKAVGEQQSTAVSEAMSGYDQAQKDARAAGFNHATCIVCTDGLAGNGEDLVEAIHNGTGMLAQVVGGAAADDAKFEQTNVFFGDRVHTDAIAIAYAFSRTPIGLGVRHGLNSACESMIVSKASGNVLHEIDGKPAVQAYEKFAAARGKPLSPEDREAFMITHELGILTPGGELKVRAPLKVQEDGSLLMAAEVPSGASVSIMDGTADGLVTAAGVAARSALANLGGARPAGVLMFDCICRRIFLGEEYRRQVDAVQSVVGDSVPITGWETYGEIAMTPSQQSGWHNSTTVLAILPD